jgi:hypothetical protein
MIDASFPTSGRTVSSARMGLGLLVALGASASAALALAQLLARSPPPMLFVIGVGVGLLGTLGLALERRDDAVRLRLSDGSVRDAEAVIVAAGFRFSLDRLTFLSPEMRAGIDLEDDWPALDRWFRTDDRRLFFVGFAAEHRFGPIARFIPGTRFTADRVRRALDR